jgi:hypothetical protein
LKESAALDLVLAQYTKLFGGPNAANSRRE